MLVHLSPDIVPVGSVVAGVQGCVPFTISVRGCTTANLVGVCPNHLGIVSYVCSKFKRLNLVSTEESHFVVPVCDCLFPVVLSDLQALFVNIQVLPHAEPFYPSTIRAVVGKLTLVCMSLRDSCQLIVPFQYPHVGCWGLRSRCTPRLLSTSNLSA